MTTTKKQRDIAKTLFEKMPDQKRLYINDKGEFFSSENLVKNSVKDSKGSYTYIEPEHVGLTEKSNQEEDPKKDQSHGAPMYPTPPETIVSNTNQDPKTQDDSTKIESKEGKQESTKKEDSKDKTQVEPKQEKNQNKNK